MALHAGEVMHALSEKLRSEGFNDRWVDVTKQDDDEWTRNFANVELHVEEPEGAERRYFDYHKYCEDLCEMIAAEFKKHGRFRVVWGKRSMLRLAAQGSIKPGDRILSFDVTPFWSVRVEFFVKEKPVTRTRAQARA